MLIASSERWTVLMDERLELDQEHRAGNHRPYVFILLQVVSKWELVLNESNHAARSDDVGGLR